MDRNQVMIGPRKLVRIELFYGVTQILTLLQPMAKVIGLLSKQLMVKK